MTHVVDPLSGIRIPLTGWGALLAPFLLVGLAFYYVALVARGAVARRVGS